MVFRRFSCFSSGDSDKAKASAIPVVSQVAWWVLDILLYHETQSSGGLGQARKQSAQEVRSKFWFTKGILLASHEIKWAGLSVERGPRQREFGREGYGSRMSET
jgi:hypothetical protein